MSHIGLTYLFSQNFNLNKMKRKLTDKQYLDQWAKFKKNISLATPIDLQESAIEKERRVKKLEADDEAWFKYYFPNFYTS